MGHHHHHHHEHHHHGTKNLAVAFWLNLSFSIIELLGGLYTNSMAIISDAVHDIGDAAAIGSAFFFEKLSAKSRDKNFSYGYKRFSTLSALITSIILIVGALWIVVEAIPRLINPEQVNSMGMLGLAVLGIVFNGFAVFKLGGNQNSLNQKAVRLHLIEDLLGWIAVLVGSIFIYFFNWLILDPILSLVIALYISVNAFKNLKSVSGIFLQGIPQNVNLKRIEQEILNLDDVTEVHDFHLWSMDGEYNILTLHAVVDQSKTVEELKSIKQMIKEIATKNHIQHVTLEFESSAEDCALEDC